MLGCRSKERKIQKPPPPVMIVGAAAFVYASNHPDTELFILSISEMDDPEAEEDLSMVPLEYKEFEDLFNKKEADKLLPHRPYDHQIPVEPSKTLPFGPIYKLSPVEPKTLRKYIEENLRKRFICNSQSGLAFGRTQPRSGPNPDRESQYFGSDRVETSSIRSDIGFKIGRT